MHRFSSRFRRPVKRLGAEQHILVTLLAFALSVSLTRLFLALTGYPQIGGEVFHIAHALWGGLLLYIAALLPLVLANRWVYMVGAVLTGMGVGLFIDEVGKFITQANDYFFPLAAPIVYAFFLLSVGMYLRVRRPRERSVRGELFRALEALEEALEQDLDPEEKADLEEQLTFVMANSTQPHMALLARNLLDFIHSDSLQIVPRQMGLVERTMVRWRAFETRWLSRRKVKAGIVLGLLLVGGIILVKMSFAARALQGALAVPLDPVAERSLNLFQEIFGTNVYVERGLFRYLDIALETLVSISMVLSAVLFTFGRERFVTALANMGLLLALTGVNLLVFYYDQFSNIVIAGLQLILLVSIGYYRQRYLKTDPMVS